jgi:hypothetical protein
VPTKLAQYGHFFNGVLINLDVQPIYYDQLIVFRRHRRRIEGTRENAPQLDQLCDPHAFAIQTAAQIATERLWNELDNSCYVVTCPQGIDPTFIP